MKHSVSFTDVTIFEFPLRIGDNPACTSGCPITLANKHQSVRKSSLSEDDENISNSNVKSISNTRRRSSKDLIIPSDVRTKLLMANGYELQRIVKTTENILKIQEQRRESLQKTHWEGVKSFFQPNNNGKTNFKASTIPPLNRASATTA
jgi:CRISPR/Cas system CMR subunit Cmr4 (Cas7 group RAMP superfamily)